MAYHYTGGRMSISRRDQFAGSNNIAKPERLPEGAVVDALNMDFTVGGKMELRTGFTKVADGKYRMIAPHAAGLLMIGDDDIVLRSGGIDRVIGQAPAGDMVAVEHNGKTYIAGQSQMLEVSDRVEPWFVEEPVAEVVVASGNLPAGIYKVAVTQVVNGKESGCVPFVVTLSGSQSIVVNVQNALGSERLYCSVANGQTLYHQGRARATNLINSVVDDSGRLETAFLESLPSGCTALASFKSLVVAAKGRNLYHSRPMMPHLHDPESDWIAFPADITLIAPVADGVYVCADKTYFVGDIGSPEMYQRTVAGYGAIAGTYVRLPDGTATWFSRYGQITAGAEGAISAVNRASYAPEIAADGASGFIEHNGNQLVVTSMRGEAQRSHLQACDHWEFEVV